MKGYSIPPQLDGEINQLEKLIEKFKQGAAYSPKDFVIFTGADVPEQREKARKSGYRVLTKPAKIDELIEVLKKICVRHKLLKKKS